MQPPALCTLYAHADARGFIVPLPSVQWPSGTLRSRRTSPRPRPRPDVRELQGGVAAADKTIERMGRHHLEVVRAKIRELQAIETSLSATISRCTGASTPECPLLDILADNHAASRTLDDAAGES